jgi:hypothetical protein
MFLSRKGEPAWSASIRDTLTSQAFRENQDELLSGFTVKRGNFALRFW